MTFITNGFAAKTSITRLLASAFLLAIASLNTPVAASEDQFAKYSVTPEERAACTPDVLKFCSTSIPSPTRIIACMKKERAKLSPACGAAFDARVAQSKTATRSIAANRHE